jgi:hypothetical protein
MPSSKGQTREQIFALKEGEEPISNIFEVVQSSSGNSAIANACTGGTVIRTMVQGNNLQALVILHGKRTITITPIGGCQVIFS